MQETIIVDVTTRRHTLPNGSCTCYCLPFLCYGLLKSLFVMGIRNCWSPIFYTLYDFLPLKVPDFPPLHYSYATVPELPTFLHFGEDLRIWRQSSAIPQTDKFEAVLLHLNPRRSRPIFTRWQKSQYTEYTTNITIEVGTDSMHVRPIIHWPLDCYMIFWGRNATNFSSPT